MLTCGPACRPRPSARRPGHVGLRAPDPRRACSGGRGRGGGRERSCRVPPVPRRSGSGRRCSSGPPRPCGRPRAPAPRPGPAGSVARPSSPSSRGLPIPRLPCPDYTRVGYILATDGRCTEHRRGGLRAIPAHGIRGLVGAGPRLRDLGDRAGLGAAAPDRERAVGRRVRARGQSDRPRCGLLLVLWVLIGWQFTLAEYVGGILLIVLMSLLLRAFVSPRLEERARRHAQEAASGHEHHAAVSEGLGWRRRLTSGDAWFDVAHNFRGDWQMLWKEIAIGFFLAGFIGLLGNDFWSALFVTDAPPVLRTLENVLVGPVIAVLSFVCSIGNVPLAAVLWSGGISFGGVISFLFADLIVLPILVAYRKYYGFGFALRITALMFVTMVVSALIIDALFGGLGLIPSGARPSRADVFGSVTVNYKLFLNVVASFVFAALLYPTIRRGATDPVCGMKVDRARAIHKEVAGQTYHFCSEHCLHAFEADPDRYRHRPARARQATHA